MPGDSFNWSWVRDLSLVKYLAIHHSAGPDSQTPVEIANYHINSNGWGGIGYHFLVDKNGMVYYVGDISTARANVANLNDAVIGICLIGNFTQGQVPTDLQLDSTRKLCDFFINSYPDLSNIDSWDKVAGHKDLPGQATTCPGDNWPLWRVKLVAGLETGAIPSTDRGVQISELYRVILGRDPDMGGLQTYTGGGMTIDQIIYSLVSSDEHKELIRLSKDAISLKGQVDNMQTSLTSINQQLLILQEALQEKDREIARLGSQQAGVVVPDNTQTIAGIFVDIFKFIFLPRKAYG